MTILYFQVLQYPNPQCQKTCLRCCKSKGILEHVSACVAI